MKDARLLLPLTEVMKIARLTSPLVDTSHQSLPKPRLRHGRRLALLFHPNLTLNLYSLFFPLSLALLPGLPSLLTSVSVLLGSRLWSVLITCNTTFLFFQPKALRSRARGYLSELCQALRSLSCLYALLSLPLNFMRLPPTSPSPLPLAQTKLPIPL